MLVDDAPVPVIARPPPFVLLVVSADSAMTQDGVLSITVVALLTRTVVPALASRLISPSTFHAAHAEPSLAF